MRSPFWAETSIGEKRLFVKRKGSLWFDTQWRIPYSQSSKKEVLINSTNQLNEVEVHRFRGQIVVKNRTSLDSKRIVSYQPAEEVLVRLHVFVFFQYVRVA